MDTRNPYMGRAHRAMLAPLGPPSARAPSPRRWAFQRNRLGEYVAPRDADGSIHRRSLAPSEAEETSPQRYFYLTDLPQYRSRQLEERLENFHRMGRDGRLTPCHVRFLAWGARRREELVALLPLAQYLGHMVVEAVWEALVWYDWRTARRLAARAEGRPYEEFYHSGCQLQP